MERHAAHSHNEAAATTVMVQVLSEYFGIDVATNSAGGAGDPDAGAVDARDKAPHLRSSPILVPARRLCRPDGIRELLRRQPPDMVHKEQESVSGVMAAKLYGGFPVGVIFAASVFDIALPTDLSKIKVQLGGDHGFRFQLPVSAVHGAPHLETAREDRFAAHLAALFQDHVAPIFEALHATSNADRRSMWSLLSTNIKTLYLRGRMEPYRTRLQLTDHRLAQLKTDEDRIFTHGSAGPFPNWRRNPLVQPTRLFTPPPGLGEPTYLRTKCCLRYRIRVNGEHVPYCVNCPKISDQERLRILKTRPKEEME